jgi:mannonate dehydratase
MEKSMANQMLGRLSRLSRDPLDGDQRVRRGILQAALLGGGATLARFFSNPLIAEAATSPREQAAQAAAERATTGMPTPKIKDLSVIDVAAGSFPHTVVKVTTDQAGLYGYGDASSAGPGASGKLVNVMVEQYLKPLVVGRTVDRIEQIWQLCYQSSYYKNDHVQNCGIAGVCDALWDIKGRQAGMPVYQLVGGKCRDASDTYVSPPMGASGQEPARAFVEGSKKLVAEGYRNIKYVTFARDGAVKNAFGTDTFPDGGEVAIDRDKWMRQIYTILEAFRKEVSPDIKLVVDVHSALDGLHAVQFCKDCEQFRPWLFIEDVLPVEEAAHYRLIRQQSTTPQAIGECWDNPHEWRFLVEERLIDYIRHHVSHIGGFTAARKIANYAENFEVKFAWHGVPKSPVGTMADVTIEQTCENFGTHEHNPWSPLVEEIYKGDLCQVRNGYMFIDNLKPGWGIEIDEALAAKHSSYTEKPAITRTPDGSYIAGSG